MKRFFGSLFLKMLAMVTVCILVPLFVFFTLNVTKNMTDEMYFSENPGFENSTEAQIFVQDCLADIREYIYWHDIAGIEENEYNFGHKNFFYEIYDNTGKKVLSTLPPNAEIHMPEEEGSTGMILIMDNYPAREVNEDGKPVAYYTLSGYIRMPMDPNSAGYEEYKLYSFGWNNRSGFIQYGVIIFIVCTVLVLYLIAGAGRNGNGELELRGLNAIGYDLMIFLYLCGIGFLLALASDIRFIQNGFRQYLMFSLAAAGATVITLILLMNISAHLKMPHWWRYCVIYRCLEFAEKVFFWFFENIGITWQLVLIVAAFGGSLYLMGVLTNFGAFWFFLAFLLGAAGIAVAVWIGSQLHALKRGGEAVANGNFDYRVNAKELWPVFRRHAFNLNSAALGMSKEVDNRMKSEHFKTELITNVSHDLKTPLTSIVSYIDLLKMENIENENAKEYIEVIDRQAAKLKKLTEDLVEASKATTGAIAVNKEELNIGELMNQSIGEFTEKLENAEIVPVLNLPEEEIKVFADGRLLWRVFDNLTQNIIKYAQPGTRAYFDLTTEEKNAVLTIKNISKEPLNMTAEALMERFVRGDASRGETEGNGLGLSIAKSLTELCGGSFELFLDGDLYKVVITLPRV